MYEVTLLKMQKRNNDRVNVYLDGEYAFAVSLLAAARLHKGQELTEPEVEELRREGGADLAYRRAIKYLSFRPRSRAETYTYLEKKGCDAEMATTVIDRLSARGYLDDEAFAQFWVDNRSRFRPRSARALRYELRLKGVSNTTIDGALAELDEEETAWHAVEQRIGRWNGLDQQEFEHKVMAYLSRRGFTYAVSRHIAGRAWRQIEDD